MSTPLDPDIDIAAAVNELVPQAQYTQSSTYELLEQTWTDVRTLPTRVEIANAWNAILSRANVSNRQELTTAKDRVDSATSTLIYTDVYLPTEVFSQLAVETQNAINQARADAIAVLKDPSDLSRRLPPQVIQPVVFT